ncbi:MAG: ABC transporter substrate-binding protein [Kiloniellaceae bacterium]
MLTRYLATAGFILAALTVPLSGPLSGTAAAAALDLPIVFLTRAEEPRLPLSFVDPVVEDPGVWGARLAIKDNQTTGSFLGHTYELVEVTVPADGDAATVFAEQRDAGRHLFISDLPRDDLLAIARLPGADDTLIFNDRVADDDLRLNTCFAPVFHTALSRAMRADALVQFLVWKKWTDLFLFAGSTDGDQAYAEAMRRAAKKFGARIVAEDSYAYDPSPGAPTAATSRCSARCPWRPRRPTTTTT